MDRSATTAAGTSGSGLGLAISKAIAGAHGGTIRLADPGGTGTRFVVERPLASDGAEAYQLATGQVPDMAVLDVMMPGLDGYQLSPDELLTRVRAVLSRR